MALHWALLYFRTDTVVDLNANWGDHYLMNAITPFQWICIAFVGYWVVVLIWIKGTEVLANPVFRALWLIIRIPLTLCGVFVVFALLCGAGSKR